MSKIIPFEALVPSPELAGRVICPPYDVIDTAEARKLAFGNPYSLLHVTRPEIDLPPNANMYSDEAYERGAKNLKRLITNGTLSTSHRSFYIYRIEHRGRSQTGIVCGASVDEYDSGLIKKHEKTREEKVADRAKNSLQIGAHVEPVFLAHRRSDTIARLIRAETGCDPIYDITAPDGVRHQLWRALRTDDITDAFAALDAIYIADGHHRSEAASRVRRLIQEEKGAHDKWANFDFFPAVVFSEDEVQVYKYDWSGDADKRPLADVQISDIMKLSDKNGIMPPKSTWFAPKLISGLFIYPLKREFV